MVDSNHNWGEMIEKTINFGREDRSSKLKKIKYLGSGYEKFLHCSHVMIYAETKSVFETFPKKAFILMHMRADGYIGFPGGLVDENETPLQAVCRELKEEVGWSEEKGAVSNSDYMFTHIDEENECLYHFYAVKIPEAKFEEIQKNSTKALDYGNEVLGHFKVPLYVLGDAFKGFPSFLRNHFAGNAKLQLLEAISSLKLLTEEQIVQALHSAPRITF